MPALRQKRILNQSNVPLKEQCAPLHGGRGGKINGPGAQHGSLQGNSQTSAEGESLETFYFILNPTVAEVYLTDPG